MLMMSSKRENAMEEFEKAFKYFLKEPEANNSLKKYLSYCSGGTKNDSNSSFLQEKCNKFEETLCQSQIKTQFQHMTYKLNEQVVEYDDDAPATSLKLKRATGIAKNFAPQTCGVKFNKRQPVLEMQRVKDSIECDFKTAREELQLQNLKTTENIRDKSRQKSVEISDDFKTAREELKVQRMKRHGSSNSLQGAQKKKQLGGRRGVYGKFVSPVLSNSDNEEATMRTDEVEVMDERLKNIDPKMIELIRSEIMDNGATISWEDIAGLEFAKNSIQEAVVWPMLRPDIFTGLRRPPKAILLFGPPGTGKTLIGKCVASQSKSTFFSISASSLTSKWIGDGEKMVRALFSVARCHQPAVIFIDEVDSLLSQRSDTEHECSRRMKTEFLVQLDGATTDSEERLLVIGATNRPQELDEAARRRFVKRLYIPLPVLEARRQLVRQLMKNEKHQLTEVDIGRIAELSDGYSGADMKNLCCEAALGPIRCMDFRQIETISAADVRPILMGDFENALQRVKSSVADKDLEQLITWNQTYGSSSGF